MLTAFPFFFEAHAYEEGADPIGSELDTPFFTLL